MRRGAVAAVAVLAVVAWALLGAWRADPPARAQQQQQATVGHSGAASFLPGFPSQRPFFVVAIGSDARPGVCEPVERCLADSIHLIGVNPQKGAATIVGIPRDSYVSIPGHGQARINDSLFVGGPELVVETVEELAGVETDGYFLTSFEGFRHLIEEIGGVEVDVPYAMNDPASGATLDAGRQRLDGQQALAFSRNRKDTPDGDFSRTENQGLLILGALEQFQSEVEDDPTRLFDWLVAGAHYVQTEIALPELFQLALASLQVDPGEVTNVALPGGIQFVGKASVVTLGGEADALLADVADDAMISG